MHALIRTVLVVLLTGLEYIVTPRILAGDHDARSRAASPVDDEAEKKARVPA
jgi:hypothetical protein